MRTDNVPAALLDEAVREQLFGRHKPYAMPIIGYADDIKKLGVNDLMAFYRRYYAPSNAVLIVAGDTTTDAGAQARREVLRPDRRAARSSRGTRPTAGRHRPAAAGDPRRCARRRAALVARLCWRRPTGSARRNTPMRCRCWRACSAAARPAACGASLVMNDKLALSAWAGYSPSSLGLTSFEHRRPSRDRRAPWRRSRTAVTPEMKKLLDGGVTAEEVERAQNQLLAARDLLAGFAGERPAHLRHRAEHRRHHGRHRCLAAAHRRRHAGRRGRRRPPCLARRRAR